MLRQHGWVSLRQLLACSTGRHSRLGICLVRRPPPALSWRAIAASGGSVKTPENWFPLATALDEMRRLSLRLDRAVERNPDDAFLRDVRQIVCQNADRLRLALKNRPSTSVPRASVARNAPWSGLAGSAPQVPLRPPLRVSAPISSVVQVASQQLDRMLEKSVRQA